MKTKVLHFPMRNSAGGVTQYALNNWNFIDKKNFQFDFATLSKKLDFEDNLVSQGCKVHYLSCSAEDNEKQFIKEFGTILSEGYNAVHLHTCYWKSFACEIAAKEAAVPVVIVHSHSTDVDVITGNEKREEAIAWHKHQRLQFNPQLATHFCACSQKAADWIFGPQIPKEKIKILNNAIDVEKFAFNLNARECCRRMLNLDNHFVIGHVGRFEYQKNHEFLIDTFIEVNKSIPNAKLMLIGVGPKFDQIRAKVETNGLMDKVLFLGKRDDMADLYQAMDLFVLPSRFEGLSICLVEALSSGVKCISSPTAFPENAIANNIFSLPLEVEPWRNAIIDIATMGYTRKDCSTEVAKSGYSIKERVHILEKIYLGEEL